MTVINCELTVHCKDVEKARVIVNHRSYGSIIRFKLDEDNTVRIFLDNRDDFNKLFNILNWNIEVEEVANGSEDEE